MSATTMKTVLWKGSHGPEVLSLIRSAWSGEFLLVLCPSAKFDKSVLKFLPAGPVEFQGEWADAEKAGIPERIESSVSYPYRPLLGIFSTGTSGGLSKLILYSRENILSSLEAIRSLFDASRIRKVICLPQPFHTFGLTLGYIHALEKGLELCVPPGAYSRQSAQYWLGNVDESTLTLELRPIFRI